MLNNEVWIVFWDPWILLHVSRIEWYLINKDQSASVSNENSHEWPEYFSSFHNIWIKSLDRSLNRFLPTTVQFISQNRPHLKSFKMYFSLCVGMNLISNISCRFYFASKWSEHFINWLNDHLSFHSFFNGFLFSLLEFINSLAAEIMKVMSQSSSIKWEMLCNLCTFPLLSVSKIPNFFNVFKNFNGHSIT